MRKILPFGCIAGLLLFAYGAYPQIIGNHRAVYDSRGTLLPWTSWQDAIDREMKWYLACPIEHGYPRFVWMTFMKGDYTPIEKQPDFIPSTQNGAGIISYLKYYAQNGRKNPKVLEFAKYMGDYLVKESLTPDTGKYPRFTRSTGWRARFPQPPDCGSQADKPYEIEPDKGGVAGYALVLLYEETKEKSYCSRPCKTRRYWRPTCERVTPGIHHGHFAWTTGRARAGGSYPATCPSTCAFSTS